MKPAPATRQLIAVLLSLLLPVASVRAMELDTVAELARQGAPQLSLQLIEQFQPDFFEQPQAWYQWESRRMQILESRQDWQGIVERYRGYADELEAGFQLWAEELLVKAQLELGHPRLARRHLRHLLWSNADKDQASIKRYRDLVIRSYMAEAAVEPAQIAMLRYQQDYPNLDPRMKLLRAEVLLASARNEEARAVLAQVKSEESEVLSLLASLRQKQTLTEKEAAALRRMASQVNLPRRVRYLAWATQAELARLQGKREAAILAQERALALESGFPSPPFVDTNARGLWRQYDAEALTLGNEKQLLQGDDTSWLELAQTQLEHEPLRSRSLYAYLARHAVRAENRTLAHERLIDQVLLLQEGEAILERLYRPLFEGDEAGKLPTRIRYFFADRALSRGDVRQASRYLAHLDSAPAGEDDITWNQRRARILIMAGQTEEGIDILRSQLQADTPLRGQELDRFIQVVFDLQTVKEHEAAIELFSRILEQNRDIKLQRELHFWMADSYRELGRLELATVHYLKSAVLSSGGEGVLWAQSAKYQAARTLAQAGLYDDARTLYLQLLKATDDTDRKAVLRHEMQGLRLKQVHSHKGGDSR